MTPSFLFVPLGGLRLRISLLSGISSLIVGFDKLRSILLVDLTPFSARSLRTPPETKIMSLKVRRISER